MWKTQPEFDDLVDAARMVSTSMGVPNSDGALWWGRFSQADGFWHPEWTKENFEVLYDIVVEILQVCYTLRPV